jgi:hypothetical protein
MRTKFARTMHEAFPHTADAAQWLERPEMTGVSLSWFFNTVVLVAACMVLWSLV